VQDLTVPVAPRRRSGSDTAFRSALTSAQAELAEIDRYTSEADPDDANSNDELRRARVDLCFEIASILFAAGAEHADWRWWARQAATSLLEYGDAQSAASWAVLTGDDGLVGKLPGAPEPGHRPKSVVWWLAKALLSGQADNNRPEASGVEPQDSVDAAWTKLARAIPVGDHPATNDALRTITDFWMGEDEDWQAFHPRSYPEFEPELNAAATLALRSGWAPVNWQQDALLFLEPGLAAGTRS
jgi:hypothetical protein